MGGQIIPKINSKITGTAWPIVRGLHFGPDYVDTGFKSECLDSSFGMGLPVRRNFYTNQYTTINTYFGNRGSGK